MTATLRPRHELPGARRVARPDRPPWRAADSIRRPDRRSRRRRADGGRRDPRCASRARAVGRGPVRRHLDDRRLDLVALDGDRALLLRARHPSARRARACGWTGLLLPLRGAGRRLDLARRARAEVLAQLVRRRRPSRLEGEAVRASGFGGGEGGRRRLQAADARRVDDVRLRARLLPRADPGPRRGACLGARSGPRDGDRARPTGYRPGRAGGLSDQAVAHAGGDSTARSGAG